MATLMLLWLDQFNVISEWQHFALLSLMETKDFQSDHEWIAQCLAISVPEVQKNLQRGIRLAKPLA